METGPHRGMRLRCGPAVLARKGDPTLSFRNLELDPVETGKLAAFAEHCYTCPKCCRARTLPIKTPICVKGMLLADAAAHILVRKGIGAINPAHVGTGR